MGLGQGNRRSRGAQRIGFIAILTIVSFIPTAQAAFVYSLRLNSSGAVCSGAPNYSMDLWLRQTDKGPDGVFGLNDTLTGGIISVVSIRDGGGLISGGITGAALGPLFSHPAASKVGGPASDVNDDGIMDWGAIVASGGNHSPPRLTWVSVDIATGGTPATPVPGQSQLADDGSWEWKIATFTLSLPSFDFGRTSFVPAIPSGLALGTSAINGKVDGHTAIGTAVTSSPGLPVMVPNVVPACPPTGLTQSPSYTVPGDILVTRAGIGKYFVNGLDDQFLGSANLGSLSIKGINEFGTVLILARFNVADSSVLNSIETGAQALAQTPEAQLLYSAYGYDPASSRVFAFPNSPAGEKFWNFDLPDGVNLVQAVAVPEPAATGLLAMGVTCSLRRRRRGFKSNR